MITMKKIKKNICVMIVTMATMFSNGCAMQDLRLEGVDCQASHQDTRYSELFGKILLYMMKKHEVFTFAGNDQWTFNVQNFTSICQSGAPIDTSITAPRFFDRYMRWIEKCENHHGNGVKKTLAEVLVAIIQFVLLSEKQQSFNTLTGNISVPANQGLTQIEQDLVALLTNIGQQGVDSTDINEFCNTLNVVAGKSIQDQQEMQQRLYSMLSDRYINDLQNLDDIDLYGDERFIVVPTKMNKKQKMVVSLVLGVLFYHFIAWLDDLQGSQLLEDLSSRDINRVGQHGIAVSFYTFAMCGFISMVERLGRR